LKVLAPIEGHWFFFEVPQEVIKSVAIPTTTINFAIFMVSYIYCKLNKFDAKSEEISEINSKIIGEPLLNLSKLQKIHGDFFPIAATQHELQRKALKKIPSFIHAGCILEKRAYEQCTSEDAAIWKAHFFPSKKLLSLTGGLGVDEWAWAKSGTEVTSIDIDSNLNHLAKYNFDKLNVNIDRQTIDANDFILNNELNNYDLIYIDPDRRDGTTRITNQVASYSPNIFEIIAQNQNLNWLIKLSPMVDADFIEANLPGYKTYYAIVVKQEVKELLVHIQFTDSQSKTKREVVTIDGSKYHYSGSIFNEGHLAKSTQEFIFEPNGGLLCLKLNRSLHELDGFIPLNIQHTFFKCHVNIPSEMGRSFLPIHNEPICGGLNKIGKIIKSEYHIDAASITARECKLSTEEIRKTLGLKESDTHFIILTKRGNDFLAWVCVKPT